MESGRRSRLNRDFAKSADAERRLAMALGGDDRLSEELRVPGDVGELLLALDPLGGGEDARGGVDEARSELEDVDGSPRAAVAGAQAAKIEHVGHARKRQILDDHFGESTQDFHFGGILFEMAAVGGDAKAVGKLASALGGGGKRARHLVFDFALPLDGDGAPAFGLPLEQSLLGGQFGDGLAKPFQFSHGSLPAQSDGSSAYSGEPEAQAGTAIGEPLLGSAKRL